MEAAEAWAAMERAWRSAVRSETASCAGTPRAAHSSRSLHHRHSQSMIKTQEGAVDMSPRCSYGNPTTNRDKMLHRRQSLNLPQHFPGHRSSKIAEKANNATSKSIADLAGEIAALEQEVIRKELHLLSLYRRVYLPNSCSFSEVDQEPSRSVDEGALRLRDIKQSAAFNLPTVSDSKSEVSRSASKHPSLVNFLSASISDYVPKISCKLSEDILSCIASVYCKLASMPSQDADSVTSPSPSVSSSSTFSPRRRNDSWSPRYNFDATTSPSQYGYQKEHCEQNIGMIIVPRIRIDADKFEYCSKMLETFRSLIERLKKIDPTKMTHEEQLCFWINLYNALVMHAFLAYGIHDKRMKSSDTILKAVYNVGGESVTAQTIQNAILGCQSHRPSLWVRTLFTPAKRSMAGSTTRHPYALHHSEPIVHFVLSTGTFSDPPVRLYTAKKIHHQLEQARTEFIQANVMVKKHALMLPKVLHYYAKDAALELRHLVELVCESMSETQRKEMAQLQHRLKGRIDKRVEWLPYKSNFRYVVHKDLAE